MRLRPPGSSRTSTLCPYSTVFRSVQSHFRNPVRHICSARDENHAQVPVLLPRCLNEKILCVIDELAVSTANDCDPIPSLRKDSGQRSDEEDRKSTRLNSSHKCAARMPSPACNNKRPMK